MKHQIFKIFFFFAFFVFKGFFFRVYFKIFFSS